MKTPSHDLFLLIKSLSKTEKRYFKKFSELHGKQDNQYLLLFDAIAKQKQFDEEELKKQFKGQAFLRQFPVAKNYLYARILDSLEFYHRDASVHSTVRRNIYRAELLQKKGLHDQSMKPLHKAKEEAQKFDLFHALLEIHTQWAFKAILDKYDLHHLEKLHNDALETSSLLGETIACRSLSLQMVNVYHHYYLTRDHKYAAHAAELIKSPYYKKPESLKTFAGKMRVYKAKFFYWHIKGDLASACREGERAAKICLDTLPQVKNNILMYMDLLSTLYYAYNEQKKYDAAYDCLCKLEEAVPLAQTYSHSLKFFYRYDTAHLHYLYTTGKFEEMEKTLADILHKIDLHESDLNDYEKIALLTTISYSSFYIGNLKQSLLYMNKLRNEYDLSLNPEVQFFLYVFFFAVHYDAGHYEILLSLIQSLDRFLHKKSYVLKAEVAMISLFKKMLQSDETENLKEPFALMKKEIENIPLSQKHYFVSKPFDIVSWVESKMKKKPFIEIIKAKGK